MLPRKQLSLSRDSFDYHIVVEKGMDTNDMCVEARDAVKHPIVHRAVPHNKVILFILKCQSYQG